MYIPTDRPSFAEVLIELKKIAKILRRTERRNPAETITYLNNDTTDPGQYQRSPNTTTDNHPTSARQVDGYDTSTMTSATSSSSNYNLSPKRNDDQAETKATTSAMQVDDYDDEIPKDDEDESEDEEQYLKERKKLYMSIKLPTEEEEEEEE